MSEILITILLFTGALFLLLAAIGILRMPDFYTRIQANAKAATLGAGCMVLALAVHFNDLAITIRALLIVAFLFLTSPVAAHVLGRSAYIIGVPQWENTLVDQLRSPYEAQLPELDSTEETGPPAAPSPGPSE